MHLDVLAHVLTQTRSFLFRSLCLCLSLPLPCRVWQEPAAQNVHLLYTVLDVEGHESCVIAGMSLQHERFRRIFAAFQYEIGGCWAARDPRHPPGSMSLYEVALFLHSRGYRLYLIGARGGDATASDKGDATLLPLQPEFFQLASTQDEGFGPFVAGNVLAIHPDHADPALVALADSHTVRC